MKSAATLFAFAGYAAATQMSYGAPPAPPGPVPGPPGPAPAPVCPTIGSTDAQGRYSCNPAHQYPPGQVCKMIDGCPYLTPEGPSSTTSTTTAPAPTSTCPAAGSTAPDGRYSCNPAHKYPDGQVCTLIDGCYYLRTETPGLSVTQTTTAPAPTSTCPAPGSTSPDGRYSCNPAHKYPDGQVCTLIDGCYYLRTETPGVSVTASTTPSGPVYVTTTVSAFTTYCPSATTFTHEASTYVVTQATVITVPCPGGCVVTHPVTTPPAPIATTMPTVPIYTPTTVVPSIPVAKNTTTPTTPAIYTGAGALATGAPLAAMAALGALLL